jgi:hypothetical protein
MSDLHFRAPQSRSELSTFADLRSIHHPLDEIAAKQRDHIQHLLHNKFERDASLLVGSGRGKQIVGARDEQSSHEERVFEFLVQLKTAVSTYAMHLSNATRQKLFGDLDAILNAEDWYENDAPPRLNCFRDFLKWTIYSKRFNWLSFGFSDDGEILVAWKTHTALLTARFKGNGRVMWTANRSAPDESYAAGDSALQFFERESRIYLED